MTIPSTRVPPLSRLAPRFFGAGMTHAGAVRERNEDSILTDPHGTLWAVADGMGGYGHGDVASDIVIDCLATVPDNALAGPALRAKLEEASHRIHLHAQQAGIGHIGSTAVALMIQNSVAHVAWAGDCRAYLLRGGSLRMLTHDHTVVQNLVDQGLLSDAARETHPEAHVVTRAIGFEAEVEIDSQAVPVVAGDRLLLCSDGLTACMGDQRIGDLLGQGADPQAICTAAVTAAMQAGAPDNVSVIVVFAAADEG